MNSKRDLPKTGLALNEDGVTVLRLTRMARSEDLRKHLQTTMTMYAINKRVQDAQCSADHSSGAQLFIPLTQEQIDEAEIELAFDHVVILNSDYEAFKRALQEFNCKGKRRPNLAVELAFGKPKRPYVPAHCEPYPASSAPASLVSKESSLLVENEGEVE